MDDAINTFETTIGTNTVYSHAEVSLDTGAVEYTVVIHTRAGRRSMFRIPFADGKATKVFNWRTGRWTLVDGKARPARIALQVAKDHDVCRNPVAELIRLSK